MYSLKNLANLLIKTLSKYLVNFLFNSQSRLNIDLQSPTLAKIKINY